MYDIDNKKIPTDKELTVEEARNLIKHYNELAERARYFKKTEGGREKMCKIMEDMRNEAVVARNREVARNLLKIGKLSVEDIALATGLTVEEVEALKGTLTA